MANSEKNQSNRSIVIFIMLFFVITGIVYIYNQAPDETLPDLDDETTLTNLGKPEANLPTTPADLAICFVYDTSGSMNDKVLGKNGTKEQKYIIANRALDKVLDAIKLYADGSDKGESHTVYAGLIGFGSIEYPLDKFNSINFKNWLLQMPTPSGGTPLGQAIQRAGLALLKVNSVHKHILVLTDGQNTIGENPSTVIPKLKKLAGKRDAFFHFHVVGFDVNDAVFSPLKEQDVNVFSAINETELTTQLDLLLKEKILLEVDDSPKKATPSK